jgi:hypothetical protein
MQQQQQQKLILHNPPKDQSKWAWKSIKSLKTNKQNLNLRARVSVCVRVREAIDRQRKRERDRETESACVKRVVREPTLGKVWNGPFRVRSVKVVLVWR